MFGVLFLLQLIIRNQQRLSKNGEILFPQDFPLRTEMPQQSEAISVRTASLYCSLRRKDLYTYLQAHACLQDRTKDMFLQHQPMHFPV